VLVHGESGSGKTSLIDLLRQSVSCDSQGYFVAGKYFQDSGIQEPFIMAAFSDLCDLVGQSEDFTEERSSEIQQRKSTYIDEFDLKRLSQLQQSLPRSSSVLSSLIVRYK
jgi:predicted ATPase